jgi:hypothetical protein
LNEPSRQYLNHILQEINNDDEFMQLSNITTTYLSLPNSEKANSLENLKPKREEPKKVLKIE